jgi:general secretion pathway protein A
LGLPAVVELVDPAGKVHYAFVSALGAQNAVLTVAGQTVTVPINELDRLWYGRYIMLWHPPALRQGVIRPGSRSRDVLWLRERMATIKPGLAAAGQPEFYDEALRQHITDFQRGRSLSPDGVVGLETLLHLTTAARSPGFPVLGQTSP